MNSYLRRACKASAIFIAVFFLEAAAWASVYVYEVTTASSRFQTASKLSPDAFLLYNGGFDVIYDLKVIATYPDKDMQQALRDFNLENNNSNMLLFTPVPGNIPRKPYYWWR